MVFPDRLPDFGQDSEPGFSISLQLNNDFREVGRGRGLCDQDIFDACVKFGMILEFAKENGIDVLLENADINWIEVHLEDDSVDENDSDIVDDVTISLDSIGFLRELANQKQSSVGQLCRSYLFTGVKVFKKLEDPQMKLIMKKGNHMAEIKMLELGLGNN